MGLYAGQESLKLWQMRNDSRRASCCTDLSILESTGWQ